MRRIGSIVEGHGDGEALPILIRRISAELFCQFEIEVLRPMRVGRDRLLREGGMEHAADQLGRRTGESGALLVLVDADDDCVKELAPRLRARALAARSDRSVGVVLAQREFEAWFLTALSSLRGVRGVPQDAADIVGAEDIRGAKERLSEITGGQYTPVRDQAALASRMDLQLACRARSFDKLVREVERLIAS